MPLFQRAADILTANLNGIVDHFEDPETMLNQVIRDMEDAVDLALNAAAAAVANERLLARRVAEFREREAELQSSAVALLQQQRDDQARRYLVERSRISNLRQTLEVRTAAAADLSLSLRRRIDVLQDKLQETRQRTADLAIRRRAALARRRILRSASNETSSRTWPKVARWMQQLEQSEAEADAWLELSGANDPAVAAESTEDVEAELVRMKESLRS